MRLRLSSALASALTITFGFFTVMGLLLSEGLGIPGNVVKGSQAATDILLQLVTITVALTVIIGVFNLLVVHIQRIAARKKGGIYSAVLILSFLLVLSVYIANRDAGLYLLETVLVSVESALAGLLLFALVYGAYRMMQNQVTWTGILFIVSLLIVLVGALPFSSAGVLRDAREWLLEIPVSAGARGILLGIALATLVTGVRVLIGIDRSYRE